MSWDQLLSISHEATAMRVEDRQKPIIDCPLCGQLLEENGRGIVNCPWGHFRQNSRTRGPESV